MCWIECAATPLIIAGATSSRKRRFQAREPCSSARRPNRATVTGCRGTCSRASVAKSDTWSAFRTSGAMSCRYAPPSMPRLSAVRSRSWYAMPARPLSSGWPYWTSGSRRLDALLHAEGAEELGLQCHRVHGRANVVQVTREGQLLRPGTTTDGVVPFDHLDAEPGAGEGHRRGQPVRSGSDDHRINHAGEPTERRLDVVPAPDQLVVVSASAGSVPSSDPSASVGSSSPTGRPVPTGCSATSAAKSSSRSCCTRSSRPTS